jgi:hypothetical protein
VARLVLIDGVQMRSQMVFEDDSNLPPGCVMCSSSSSSSSSSSDSHIAIATSPIGRCLVATRDILPGAPPLFMAMFAPPLFTAMLAPPLFTAMLDCKLFIGVSSSALPFYS